LALKLCIGFRIEFNFKAAYKRHLLCSAQKQARAAQFLNVSTLFQDTIVQPAPLATQGPALKV